MGLHQRVHAPRFCMQGSGAAGPGSRGPKVQPAAVTVCPPATPTPAAALLRLQACCTCTAGALLFITGTLNRPTCWSRASTKSRRALGWLPNLWQLCCMLHAEAGRWRGCAASSGWRCHQVVCMPHGHAPLSPPGCLAQVADFNLSRTLANPIMLSTLCIQNPR